MDAETNVHIQYGYEVRLNEMGEGVKKWPILRNAIFGRSQMVDKSFTMMGSTEPVSAKYDFFK